MTVKEKKENMADDLDNKSSNGKKPKSVSKSKGSKKKASASSRLNKLQNKVKELEKERDELKDHLLRKAAEFENYKRRTENEYSQLLINANAELFTELLPVFDDLERSISSAKDTKDFDGLLVGVELIWKNFSKLFEKYGVKPIVAIGEEFDPEIHEALLQVESDEYPSGTIVDEHLKGYVMNGRVLRHSQVLVSK